MTVPPPPSAVQATDQTTASTQEPRFEGLPKAFAALAASLRSIRVTMPDLTESFRRLGLLRWADTDVIWVNSSCAGWLCVGNPDEHAICEERRCRAACHGWGWIK